MIERAALVAEAAAWVSDRPHRRGVLIVGPPGAGVSSAVHAVADELGQDSRPVVVVDDCHRHSSADFDGLVAGIEPDAIVVLGAHSNLLRPALVGDWWAQGAIQRFDVPRLSTAGIAELGERITGKPLSRTAASAVHSFCAGLALYAREVFHEMPTSGEVELSQGVWVRRTSTIGAGVRLVDLATQRVARLSSAALAAAEVLAVSGSVPVEIARAVISDDALDELQRLELVHAVDHGAIRLSPPALEAGVLRSLTIARQAQIRRLVLAAIAGKTCPPDLLIRVGQWALDQRDDASSEVVVRAAEAAVARGANEIGVALGLAALASSNESLDREVQARARLVVGRCQWYVGSMRAAIEILRPILDDEALATIDLGGDEARARAGQILSELLRFGRDNEPAAELVLHTLETSGNARTRQLVSVLRPVYAAYAGQSAAALAQFDTQAADASVITAHRAWSAGAYSVCLVHAGRTEEGVRIGLRALQIANVDPRERPFSLAAIISCLVWAQLIAGGPAQVRAADGVEGFSPVRGEFRYDEGLNQLGIALLELSAGDVRAALDEFLGAQAAMRLLDPSGFLRLALSFGVEAAVLLGRGELAEQFGAQAEALPQRMSALMLPEQHRSLLWLHYLRGGSSAVRAIGEPLVEGYLAEGLYGAALRIQQAMLRLSVPCSVERAELFKATVAGAHPQALADQLLGVARGDFRLLVSAAHRLEQQGCLLLAAECLAMAEQLAIDGGDDSARTMNRKIVELLRGVGEVMSPWLVGRTSSSPLTPRELEIAAQVASGLSNAQVAKRLNIKVRTVETHLQRVFEKLGVNRRADLAMALTDT